jgi:hypothetical protein
MKDILQEFAGLRRQYAAIRQKCMIAVKEWRWATESMFALTPFFCERQGVKAGRWLDQPPRNKSGHTSHGFDADGQTVVMQVWGPGKRDCDEQFFVRSPTRVRQVVFSDWTGAGQKQLLACTALDIRNGRPVFAQFYHSVQALSRHERYLYDGGRITAIEVATKRFPGTKNESSDACREEVSYDEFGRLDSVVAVFPIGSTAYPKGRNLPLFRRPKKGETIESLSAIVEDQLVELIPQVVARARVRQPVYSLVLGYYPENPFPPVVGLGLESERQTWAAEHGADAVGIVWNPEEYAHAFRPNLDFKDAGLIKASDLLNLEIRRKKKWGVAAQLLNRVAVRLRARDWSKSLKRTRDFVLVACDIDSQVELPRNLKASVGPELFNDLKAHGWI